MRLFGARRSARIRIPGLLLVLLAPLFTPLSAYAALTVTPLAWNVIGLDSNSPTTGPKDFPIGARICSDIATTNVTADIVFDSANANVALRPGSLANLNFPAIAANSCVDAYFEAEVNQVAAAYDTTRRYHITAADGTGTYSTPTPRELYVEHLISQSRNSITNVRYGTNPGNLVSVGVGGALNLVVGNTYVIELTGGTATQGYEQFEAFINFSNAIFQILSVNTTYSADTSPYVANPSDKLYADACLWENDPNSPNYRSCVGVDGKAGGNNVVTTYTIKIVGGGGTTQTLNTLLYDFSGSSFHYNGDYAVGARIANIIDPTSANISKSFSPNPAPVNGVSALTITLTNPNAGALSGYNFVDNLPGGLLIASPPGATTSGCGTPTLTAVAGSGTINFSNGTVAGNSNCVITVDVTAGATGSFVNTTGDLFIDTVDTGHTATATLTVNNAPPPGTGICGLALATWRFSSGFSTTAPAPTSSSVTVSAAAGAGTAPISETTITADGTAAWGSNGAITPGATLTTANDEYFEFGIDTTGLTQVALNFNAEFHSANGPKGVAVFYGTTNTRPETGTQLLNNANALTTQNTPAAFNVTANSGLNPSGTTYFRVYFFNSGNTNAGSDPILDDVVFSGCGTGTPPTISKAFAPDPIAVNGVSTLTFALTNANSVPLTGAAFSDSLPAGTQVAAVPAATSTCGGTWAPTAAATALTFSGGTIPAGGSCTVSVDVTAITAGPHANVSGFLSTTETGTNTDVVATATLTALSPPQIAKTFVPSPILPGATSRLTFTIVNPNPNDAISGVAFGDALPTTPGAMTVAAVPNPSTSGCGAPTFSPVPGAGALSFSAGTIAAGGTCTVGVDVTAPTVGMYNNTSGSVSFVINAQTITSNSASGTLNVVPPNPSIALLKQVGPSATGPWTDFLAVNAPANVFYQFTIENTGDVPLSPVTLNDPTVNTSSCSLPGSLPVAVAANNNHITTCVVGPVSAVSGSHTNTATASGNDGGTVVNDTDSAIYATAQMTLVKSVTESSYTLAGDVLHYSYLVTNTGSATLDGPITVNDDRTTVSCPALDTVGDFDNFFDPGEALTCTATYTVTAADVTAASVTNIASATNGSTTSNTDSRTVPLSSAADVSVDKTLVTAGPYITGQSITYTLLVANAGPSTATTVQVTDTPSDLTITSVSGGGCAALPCTIASLASGANATITVTATINAAGAFDNTSTVSATEPDPNLSNNTDNTGNGGTAGASADVSVVKTLTTAGPYTAGQSLTYTLLIANAGPSTATNVQITDTPSNLTITGVSGGGCAALPCTIASLASGANVTITVTATINAAGAFDNASTVSATEPDPNPSNNTDNTGNGGTATAPQLTVTKSASPTPFDVGAPASYTITVTNTGTGATSANITIADTLPAGITLSSATGVNWSCSGTSTLSCTFTGTLAANASTVLTLNVAVTASATTGDNTATASGGGDPTCPAAARCSDTVPVAIVSPQLNTSKSGTLDDSVVAPSSESNPGDTIAYTITVANTGTGTATGVTLTDALLPSLNCTIGASPVTLPTDLSAGASLICTATYTLTAGDVSAGSVTNDVTTSAGNVCNPTTAGSTCTASTSTPLTIEAVISTTKTGVLNNAVVPPNNQSDVGDQIDYTITVTNSGNGPANGVNLTDPNLAVLSCTIGGSPATLPATIPTGSALVCTGTYTLTAGDINNGSVTNTATVSGSNVCPPGTGCTGTEITPLGMVPILTLTKTASPDPFVVGQPAMYTIVVTNNGTAATSGAISVADTLPAGITLNGAGGTGWSCTGTSVLACTFAGTLNPAQSTTLTLDVNVTATAVSGDNSATASGGGDTTCPAASRCTGTVPVSVTSANQSVAPTPLDTRWGLLLLIASLLVTTAVTRWRST